MTIGTLELPKEIEERLLAQAKGRPIDSLILDALEEWLEDQEDIANAEEVVAGIEAGAIKVYPANEVWSRLGLGD